MSKVFFSCFASRMKRLDIFLFIGAVFLLSLAGFNDVFGAAQASKSASSKDSGDLISLPGETAGGLKTKTTASKTKNPLPNEMLQGVVYDLKRSKALKPTDLIGGSAANMNNKVDLNVLASITKPFVNGSDSIWRKTTDTRGNIHYPYFDNYYYCLPTRLYNSFFYVESQEWSESPKLLHAEGDLQGGGWIAVYSGYIVAPFTGTFRFVGFGDDVLLVRFNKNVVLDYGWYSMTLGMGLDGSNYQDYLSGRREPTGAEKSMFQESVIYSKYRTDVWSANSDNGKGHGLQRGVPIRVQKGQVCPIEVVLTETGGGGLSTMLFVEQLDTSGKPRNANPEKLPLFRTTAHLPPHPTLEWFPDFTEGGPIWKVVDSNGKAISAAKYSGQKIKIGFQVDETPPVVQPVQQATASTTSTPKTSQPEIQYEDELPGVLYDMKLTSNGESTGLMEMQEGKQFNRMRTILSVWNLPDTAGKESLMVPYLKRFVVSNWPHRTDSTGQLFFNEFNQFSRSPVNSYKSYFYQPIISSANAPKSYSGDGRVSDGGWVAINSGYVVAPFTGKFRFVGCGDDALVVRFNNQIVLDYGCYALSLGKKLDGTWDYKAILGGTAAKTDPQNRMVLNNPVYSQCKLETYFPSVFASYGLAKGVPISVTKGKHYPIQVLVTDIEKGNFGTALLIERLDSTGVPLKKDPAKLPLFRTSSALPGHASGGFPDYDEDSPIWRVVDAKGKPIPSHKQVLTATSSQRQQKNQTGGTPKKDNSKQVVTKEKNEKDFASTGIINLPGGVKMEMIRVEAGTFTMSAKDGDNRYWEIAHQATIEKDFYLAKTEVTQAQWKAVMNSNPSGFKGDDLPVETVSWNDAMAFCEKLNKSGKAPSGWMFSLPTETQWEYAARGGNQSKGYKYSGSNNLDEVAWYYENSGDERLSDSAWSEDRLSSNHCKTHPVGTKKANELGLYDMSGNLYEWCLDDWREDRSDRLTAEFTRGNDSGGYPRSARGGGWGGSFINNRLSERGKGPSDFRKNDLGFRVALVPLSPIQTVSLPNGVNMELVKVEAGTFTMGALDGENREDEKPHEVTLKHDYFIGMTEVTQAQWKAVMNSNPSHTKGDNLPVETVSCDDAMAFCEKLNATGKAPSGWKFALPTEAQWEYAARGGKKSRGYKYSGSDDIDAVAWNGNNSGDILHPVGEKMANELGLYDMSGNVWEWCRDWYEPGYATDPELLNNNRGSERVDRGGSLWTGDKNGFGCRVACRHPRPGGNGSGRGNVGFRVALIQTEGLADASNQNKAENTDNKSSSGSNSTPKKNNPTYNPFGYTSPLMEDD